ncbi:MAG TPA: hypothetical protein PKA63_05985 [Oligoflexia bacterium]|nr:hypothetical protein [Oligoflexia bacterium]HMP48200.1 hypothetical protein [Oligoflexia bacterium]
MPSSNFFENSAGSLVSSILESAGYIYQSSILDTLGDPFRNEIGGLVYLIGIVVVVFQLAILKQSKLAMWLLIGPALFLAVIQDRAQMDNAKWSFGTRERDQGAVSAGVSEVAEGQAGANTSKVFNRYVMMVSAVVRAMVDTISRNQIENDMWFITKGQLAGLTSTYQSDEEGLRQLIHYALLGECQEALEAARTANDPTRRAAPGSVQPGVDQAGRYFAISAQKAQEDFRTLMNKKISVRNAPAVVEYLAIREAEGSTEKDLNKNKDIIKARLYSCDEIWRITYTEMIRAAKGFHEEIKKEAEKRGIKGAAINNLILQAEGLGKKGDQMRSDDEAILDANDAQNIARIIAMYMFRNETGNPDRGSLLARFAGRNDIRKIKTRLYTGHNSYIEQSKIGAEEWAEKERLIYAALSLPTYQGLALYFLGVLFPFFALLLLVPGKAQGFLIWFQLWFWAKSWDIGLAVVMQLDTIFWSLFAYQKQEFKYDGRLQEEVSAALYALQHMDPTFQMTGYYSLLAVSVLSIPVVSAQLILGSTNAGASLIAQGVTKYADFFSDATLARTQQNVVQQLQRDALDLKEMRGLGYAMGGEATSSEMLRKVGGLSGPTSHGTEARALGYGATTLTESVISPVGAQNRVWEAAVIGNRAPLGSIAGRQAAAVALGAESAAARGLNDPFSFFGGGKSNGVVDLWTKMMTAKERNVSNVASDQEMKVAFAAAKAQIEQARWDADVEKQAYEIYEALAIYGGIPVPWSGSAGGGPGKDGSLEELGRYKADFSRRIAFLKAYIDVVHEVTSTGKSVIENQAGPVIDAITGNAATEAPLSKLNQHFMGAVAGGAGIAGGALAAKTESITTLQELYENFELQRSGLMDESGQFLANLTEEEKKEARKRAKAKAEEQLREIDRVSIEEFLNMRTFDPSQGVPFGYRSLDDLEFGEELGHTRRFAPRTQRKAMN